MSNEKIYKYNDSNHSLTWNDDVEDDGGDDDDDAGDDDVA